MLQWDKGLSTSEHVLLDSLGLAQMQYTKILLNCATQSLWKELITYPKPGLVSLVDSGSHDDMSAKTFYSSILSLREYFNQMSNLGSIGATFGLLKDAGIRAETSMLVATNGVNTHRGAIFILGILVAAAAYKNAHSNIDLSLGEIAVKMWGCDLREHRRNESSHGARVRRLYKVGGAIDEVLLGYPAVYKLALPVYRSVLMETSTPLLARVQTFFTLLANVADTNILHRGGLNGLELSQNLARNFLNLGGIYSDDWQTRAKDIHQTFVGLRLSPGGCADLLGASLFIHEIESL